MDAVDSVSEPDVAAAAVAVDWLGAPPLSWRTPPPQWAVGCARDGSWQLWAGDWHPHGQRLEAMPPWPASFYPERRPSLRSRSTSRRRRRSGRIRSRSKILWSGCWTSASVWVGECVSICRDLRSCQFSGRCYAMMPTGILFQFEYLMSPPPAAFCIPHREFSRTSF